MRYVYSCNKCSVTAKAVQKKKNSALINYESYKAGWHPETGEYIFCVEAMMNAIPTNPTCPKCKKLDTSRTWTDCTGTWYIRGNCYLDKVGAKRDMYRHKLKHEDPDGNMRVTGELDHMDNKFRRMGMDTQKILRKSINNAKEFKAKIKDVIVELNEEERKVVKYLDQNQEAESKLMTSIVGDINKILSDLTSRNVLFRKKNGNFALLAEGRWMADRI